MMQKSNDAKSRRWRALALAPALILALSVTHLSSVASVIEAAASSRMPGVSDGKVTENNPVEQAVDYSQQSPSQGETLVVTTTETIHAANSTADEQEAQKVRYTAETLPQFPGGEKALLGWVADHMQYPQEAIDRNEHGRVIVKFIINEKGQVIEPEIVRSVSPSLDAEALRVVGTLPDFEPGKVNGKAVSVSYVLPVNFSLKADTASPQQADAIIKDGNVTVFVNGEANEYSVLNDINPVDIESMQIIKNDPDYPQGKIIITLKQ